MPKTFIAALQGISKEERFLWCISYNVGIGKLPKLDSKIVDYARLIFFYDGFLSGIRNVSEELIRQHLVEHPNIDFERIDSFPNVLSEGLRDLYFDSCKRIISFIKEDLTLKEIEKNDLKLVLRLFNVLFDDEMEKRLRDIGAFSELQAQNKNDIASEIENKFAKREIKEFKAEATRLRSDSKYRKDLRSEQSTITYVFPKINDSLEVVSEFIKDKKLISNLSKHGEVNKGFESSKDVCHAIQMLKSKKENDRKNIVAQHYLGVSAYKDEHGKVHEVRSLHFLIQQNNLETLLTLSQKNRRWRRSIPCRNQDEVNKLIELTKGKPKLTKMLITTLRTKVGKPLTHKELAHAAEMDKTGHVSKYVLGSEKRTGFWGFFGFRYPNLMKKADGDSLVRVASTFLFNEDRDVIIAISKNTLGKKVLKEAISGYKDTFNDMPEEYFTLLYKLIIEEKLNGKELLALAYKKDVEINKRIKTRLDNDAVLRDSFIAAIRENLLYVRTGKDAMSFAYLFVEQGLINSVVSDKNLVELRNDYILQLPYIREVYDFEPFIDGHLDILEESVGIKDSEDVLKTKEERYRIYLLKFLEKNYWTVQDVFDAIKKNYNDYLKVPEAQGAMNDYFKKYNLQRRLVFS